MTNVKKNIIGAGDVAEALGAFLNFGDKSKEMKFPLPNDNSVKLEFTGPVTQQSLDALMDHLKLSRRYLPESGGGDEVLTKDRLGDALRSYFGADATFVRGGTIDTKGSV